MPHDTRKPSTVYAVTMAELLPRNVWYALARAAGISPADIDAAMAGRPTPAVAALNQWIGPMIWGLHVARQVARRGVGLVVHDGPAGPVVLPTQAALDAAVAAFLLDGPESCGIPEWTSDHRVRGRVLDDPVGGTPTDGTPADGTPTDGAAEGGVA